MKRFLRLFLLVGLLFGSKTFSQNTIQLQILSDLSSLDLGGLFMANDLSGQPRFFQLIMITNPEGRKVFLTGKITWKENSGGQFKEILNFATSVFQARNIFSDELGNSDIRFDRIEGDKDLAKSLIEKGKPVGVFGLYITMFSETGAKLGDDYQEIAFLNPTPPSIIQPQSNSQIDLGNVIVAWTPVPGALTYKIRANALANDSQSLEEALNSGNPIINDYDAGTTAIVNLSGIEKSREWYTGQKIALVVNAIVMNAGKSIELRSEPISFVLSQSGSEGGGNQPTPNPNLVRIATLLSEKLPADFIQKINNGTLQLEDIQISDGDNQPLTIDQLMSIISYLEQNQASIKTVNFSSK